MKIITYEYDDERIPHVASFCVSTLHQRAIIPGAFYMTSWVSTFQITVLAIYKRWTTEPKDVLNSILGGESERSSDNHER